MLDAGAWDAERVPAADLPARLRTRFPDWAPYRTINGPQIRRFLDGHGVKVPTTGRRYPVDPAAVRDAMARAEYDMTVAYDRTQVPGGPLEPPPPRTGAARPRGGEAIRRVTR